MNKILCLTNNKFKFICSVLFHKYGYDSARQLLLLFEYKETEGLFTKFG